MFLVSGIALFWKPTSDFSSWKSQCCNPKYKTAALFYSGNLEENGFENIKSVHKRCNYISI